MKRDLPNEELPKIRLANMVQVLNEFIKPGIYPIIKPFDVYLGFSKEPVPWKDRNKLQYRPIKPGELWSEEIYDCGWFKCVCDVPEEYRDADLWISFNSESEALLYSKEGEPLKGFTNGEVGYNHNRDNQTKRNYPLKEFIDENGHIELYIDAGANSRYWEGHRGDEGRFGFCNLCLKNYEYEDIYFDIQVLQDLAETIDPSAPIYKPLVDGIVKIRDLYWYECEERYTKAKAIVNQLFQLSKIKGPTNDEVILEAHSHLDIAWLWPLRENKRKIIRTITNIFYLMERYPFMTFIISQPIQIEWIKEASMKLYNKFMAYEKEGRIEVQGGCWSEIETNTPGEESLARQMLYGQKYWLEEFGHYVKLMWLPDSFGFTGSLPQVLKLSGQDYFSTIKISWSWFTKFPFHDFKWEGIDGSYVVCHFPHENYYNSGSFPGNMFTIAKARTPYDVYDKTVYLYGIGDGGGGPDVGHVERLVRMKKMKCMPKMRDGMVSEIFEELNQKQNMLPTYQGELYLERHQGVLTSQNRHKQWNKCIEERLKLVESFLASKGINKYDDTLDEIWKEVLLYQFHDVQAGSAVERVYLEEQKRFELFNKQLDDILMDILPEFKKTPSENTYLFNHLNYSGEKLYRVSEGYIKYQLKPHEWSKPSEVFYKKEINFNGVVETPLLKVTFETDGFISSIYDKRSSLEMLSTYGGNKLRVFHDYGDAWDIPESYRDQDEVYMKLIERKAYRAGKMTEIVSTYVFKNSKVVETMTVDDDSSVIYFHHDMDWKDTYYLIKSCTGLTQISDYATFDIQFGSLKRSTKLDELEEIAQIEVAAQQWADLSSKKAGFTLINHARNGYYVKGDHMELSILRSTHEPGRFSDQHPTSYDYAFFIHNNAFDEKEVDKLAYIYDEQFLLSDQKDEFELPVIDNDDIEWCAFKNAYDKDGVIFRFYERSGIPSVCKITPPKGYLKAKLVNILEDELGEVNLNKLEFHPFEIKTIRFTK